MLLAPYSLRTTAVSYTHLLDQSFPQTAQGMYLDYHAEPRGITRAAADKAVGTLRFAAADNVTAACPIEKGTVCMTAEGVRLETTEDAAIAVGSQWEMCIRDRHKLPFGRSVTQDLGQVCRVLEGEGEFAGEGAYEEFKRLATVFYGGRCV